MDSQGEKERAADLLERLERVEKFLYVKVSYEAYALSILPEGRRIAWLACMHDIEWALRKERLTLWYAYLEQTGGRNHSRFKEYLEMMPPPNPWDLP